MGAILGDFQREDGPREFRDDQRVTIAGVISSYRTRTTRNNTLMAYVTLEDDTGGMELLVFSRTLNESGSYLKANFPVLAHGKLSVRDEKAPQLLCDKVFPLEDGMVKEGGPQALQKLYLRLKNERDPHLERVNCILTMFPGQSKVVLYLEEEDKRLGGVTCGLHEALLAELKLVLGEDAVVVKESKT